MMNHMKALAILAFCYHIEAAALPQIKPAILPALPVAVPGIVPAASSSAAAPIASGAASPLSTIAGLTGSPPVIGGASSPLNTVTGLTGSLPVGGGLGGGAASASPLDTVTGLTKNLPIVGGAGSPLDAVTGLTKTLPIVGGIGGPVQTEALESLVKLGTALLSVVLSVLKGGLPVPGLPMLPIPALPVPAAGLPLAKRQLVPVLPALPASTPVAGSNPLGAVTGALAPVAGVANNLPIVGGLTSGLTGGSVLGGATSGSSPLAPVAGALAPVAGTVGSVVGTTQNTVSGLPVVGPVAGSVVNSVTNTASSLPVVGGLLNPYPAALTGVPGSDPVGAFSISVIATLLSLLKKDPMSLFAPSLPIPALVKRDMPELHAAGIPQLAARQLPGLPSLSTGIPGVGIGAAAGSGIPGISPDLASLVGSIAKNIAIPGGSGLGSVTGTILAVLNKVVPEFVFQLPAVQDSVSTVGVLQLLSSINPSKFAALGSLTSLAQLSAAAKLLSPTDLAFLKTLPLPADPTNMISTIMGLADNILSLPGNVGNIKAATAALSLRNMGLAVPGL